MPFSWTEDTTPFTADKTGKVPARFILEQVSDSEFCLDDSFYYRTKDKRRIEVTRTSLGRTDLASVPLPLAWFVRSTGRHTPAALVHDHLVFAEMTSLARVAADREFRHAMDTLAVPPVRSRVMWSAVTMVTRAGMRPWGLAGLVLWFLVSLVGIIALVLGVLTTSGLVVTAALLAPIPAALLWGRQYWAGLIGGYALWPVALPAIASIGIFYGVYWPIEQLVRFSRRLLQRPPETPSGPTSYKRA